MFVPLRPDLPVQTVPSYINLIIRLRRSLAKLQEGLEKNPDFGLDVVGVLCNDQVVNMIDNVIKQVMYQAYHPVANLLEFGNVVRVFGDLRVSLELIVFDMTSHSRIYRSHRIMNGLFHAYYSSCVGKVCSRTGGQSFFAKEHMVASPFAFAHMVTLSFGSVDSIFGCVVLHCRRMSETKGNSS